MTITISRLTEPHAVIILNAIISFIQYTVGLALIAILVKIIPSVNSAATWNVIARDLQASLWPTLLRSDSSHFPARRVALLVNLGLLSSILVVVAGVVTPLGLKLGPLVASPTAQFMDAVYVKDTSPLSSATSPRGEYFYSRFCGFFDILACPGSTDANTTTINPLIIKHFNSTSHGPFNMQFRRYFRTTFGSQNLSYIDGKMSILESFILRDDMFAVEGAIVDLTETPGIGLMNHTMPPSLKDGGTWSQEMLWLEPVTTCVDTNLTIDYSLGMRSDFSSIDTVYLVDQGGFVNLTTIYPPLDRDGQHINLHQHAYKGAVLSNRFSMMALNNITRNQSNIGMSFRLDVHNDTYLGNPGKMHAAPLQYLTKDVGLAASDLDVSCAGYGGQDNANITNVGVHCGAFLGPPYRTDNGDDRLHDIASKWRHNMHVCASATKASIQRVNFSLHGSAKLSNLLITSRSQIDHPVLWAVEKTNMTIADVAIYWGRVADTLEFNSNLTTIRARELYIPASEADFYKSSAYGQASTMPGVAWTFIYGGSLAFTDLVDYSGLTNAALLKKYQSIISSNSSQGIAHIFNLIWTDIMVNNLLGTDTSTSLTVTEYHHSITYDLKFGIPLILLVLIWLPSFTIALVSLVFQKLKLSQFSDLNNHVSVGRIVTGHSSLVVKRLLEGDTIHKPADMKENDWAKVEGRTLISLKQDGKNLVEESGLLGTRTPVESQ